MAGQNTKRHITPTIADYVGHARAEEANNLLPKYGIPKVDDYPELINSLHYAIKIKGQEALFDLARIHPDRELILLEARESEKASNACGCSGADGEQTPPEPIKELPVVVSPALIPPEKKDVVATSPAAEPTKKIFTTEFAVLIFCVTLLIGLVIGNAIKK